MISSPSFLEDLLVECGESHAELCPIFVRGHGIENRCLVLKCERIKGVLLKNVKFRRGNVKAYSNDQ